MWEKIVEGGLYPGTSKSAEGYAARDVSPSQSSDAVSDVHSIQSETGGIDSNDYMTYDLCTCGSSGRAHKSDCLMNFRKRHLPQSPGESKPATAHSPPLSNPGPPSVSPEPECVVIDDVSPPPIGSR